MQRTVMVVDDNRELRLSLGWILSREGYRVLTAENGADGLEAAQQTTPDLILLDLRMPRMDGWETIRHLREWPATRCTPVLAYTADLFCPVGQNELIEAGFTAYLSKNASLPELLAVLTSYLG